MNENCTHDCSSCGENCPSRNSSPADFIEKLNPLSKVNKTIGIVSGKGGVGKSLVTSMLAVMAKRAGLDTAVLDADITGPSIPKAFGLTGMAEGTEQGILPRKTATGIDVMSINLLLDDVTAPVVWRGPVIGGVVKQFWQDVIWQHEDVMFIDMPPGTGDVPLTVFQSIPLDGIIVVTSPQELVGMIVEKAVNMAGMMDIPVLGIVENMALFVCPKCGHMEHIFGEGGARRMSEQYKVPVLGQLPLETSIREQADSGRPTVVSHPDSEVAAIYRNIALQAAAAIAQRSKDMSRIMPSVKVMND